MFPSISQMPLIHSKSPEELLFGTQTTRSGTATGNREQVRVLFKHGEEDTIYPELQMYVYTVHMYYACMYVFLTYMVCVVCMMYTCIFSMHDCVWYL